jgi:putative transposase
MLIGQLNDDIKRIFQSIADGSDFEIEVMETDKDHIHFLIRYIPRLSISQMVRRLKQESTRQIWLLHPSTLLKNVLKRPDSILVILHTTSELYNGVTRW